MLFRPQMCLFLILITNLRHIVKQEGQLLQEAYSSEENARDLCLEYVERPNFLRQHNANMRLPGLGSQLCHSLI